MKKDISVIVPTFNERQNVVPLIAAIHQELRGYPHEIVIVDDDSPDGTYEEVRRLKDPLVRTFCRRNHCGFAKAIRHGLEQAEGDILVVMDSDFNHRPQDLGQMIALLKDYDCVSASRFLRRSWTQYSMREVLSRVFNAWIRWMTGSRLSDHLFGFFAVKRQALERCRYEDIFWGFGDYFIRLGYYFQKNRVCILEIPAVPGRRKFGVGNKKYVKTFVQYFFEVIRLTAQPNDCERDFERVMV